LAASAAIESHQSFAIVTPTYAPDLQRCELLADSLDHTMPQVRHYLIVDRRDRSAFLHLQRGNRLLIESESLVGNRFWRTPGRKGFWLSLKAPPVRGWIIQQILKIAAIQAVPERTLIFCDSDTAFFRPFERNDLLIDGKVGLLDVEFVNDDIRRWTSVARRLFGLPSDGGNERGHVGNMICWNRETVEAMQQRIQAHTGLPWQVALARTSSFSEYVLYGVFVREVMGYAAVDHAPSAAPLVKASWGLQLTTESAIDGFFAEFDPRTVAVMVHSKDDVDMTSVRRHLVSRWDQASR
jgi:hypothetical protein